MDIGQAFMLWHLTFVIESSAIPVLCCANRSNAILALFFSQQGEYSLMPNRYLQFLFDVSVHLRKMFSLWTEPIMSNAPRIFWVLQIVKLI